MWKADNSNSVRRMSYINESLLTNMQNNSDKVAKLCAIKEFDESKWRSKVSLTQLTESLCALFG